MRLLPILTLSALLLAADVAAAGTSVCVTVNGAVDFTGITTGPLAGLNSGDPASMTFLLDSDLFVNSDSFPTRGYIVNQDSFALDFPSVSVGLQVPFPAGQKPYFVLRDNDPAVDGFLLSTSVDFPVGVPTDITGGFGKFVDNFYVTYGGTELSSLDLLGALGSYDFTGLTVFNWTFQDGPFDAMGLVFETMTIELEGDPWTDLGCALSGVAGDPLLVGSGPFTPGSLNALTLSNAAPGAPLGIFFGLASTPVPFKGGTLKPFPFFAPVILATDPLGALNLPFILPPAAPSGLELFVQHVIQDGAAMNGFAMSNAVKGTVP